MHRFQLFLTGFVILFIKTPLQMVLGSFQCFVIRKDFQMKKTLIKNNYKNVLSTKGRSFGSISVLFVFLILCWTNIRADTINCYPVSAEYNTGTVNNSATITQTSEIWEQGGDEYRGWSKFDISNIPDCAIINNVELYIYFNDINHPWFYWYRLDNDPLTLIGDPGAIYFDCGEGAEYLHYEGGPIQTGWYSNALEGSAVADLQSALTDDWFGIGHKTADNIPNYYYHADGWNEANPPYLTVTCEIPADYLVSITPDMQTGGGVPDSDVWYDLTVANQGQMNDTYNLSVSDNLWNTTIWDENGATQITTLYLDSADSVGIKVCVNIPTGASGEDNVIVFATSQVEPTVMDSASITTIADGEPPTVTVIAPNGGENWGTYGWHTITWVADDNIGVSGDSVFYSTNNGTDWTLIATHIGNPQSYSWQIPNTPSDQCLVKVKIFDVSGNCTEDISDDNFNIFYQENPLLIYAIVIKQSTYNNPDWQAVADALIARYQGLLFIWNSSLYEVLIDVAAFHPTHIGFVCELSTASPDFVQNSVWPFTRILDIDPYCDAVWGIITGYNAQDALNLVSGPTGFEVKTVLGGTGSCDLNYYTQGIATSECTYGQYSVKYPDSLETTTYTDGPTDRTEWLVTMINDGIDIFNYDPVDIFYTSGHANYNEWQLHYPSSGSEGYFRSNNGQVYGDPHSGPDININSDNPKIYFGLGNCYIGKIINSSCMAPSWIHTGGAYQYTGYVIPEGTNSHQHGGTKAYFYKVARNYTWAEAFFLANIALKFDMINGTPGAYPPDLNGSALYGDPGMQVKMSNEGVFQQPLFTSELIINEGTEKDTVTFKITMNRQGNPGYDGKWGNRHPAIILPFRAENIEIIYTDAMAVVVQDNFALMYIWHQGQPSLAEGETREVVFTCNNVVGVDEPIMPTELAKVTLYQNYPNPFSASTTISFSFRHGDTEVTEISIYNIKGQRVKTFRIPKSESRIPNVVWDGRDEKGKTLPSGIYLYRITAGDFTDTKKCVILR